MILTPSKKIIRPNSSFRTLDDLRRRKQIRPSDAALRLQATIAVSERGRCLGKETFPCRSFNATWMRIMKLLMLSAEANLNQSGGTELQAMGLVSEDNLYVISTTPSYFDWIGPVIGVGTTAQTPNDTRMEKQMTHGSAAPNASVLTGTTHASQSTTSAVYDNGGKSFANDQYNHYFIEITSGALSGQERIILDTYDSTPDYVVVASTSIGNVAGHFASEPDGVTYKIKTYGMMTHGSVGITEPEDDGDLTSTMTITRTFANGCGETLEVTEFGLKIRMASDIPSGYMYAYPLVVRDVRETAVSIANGQELTLTYTFACEA